MISIYSNSLKTFWLLILIVGSLIFTAGCKTLRVNSLTDRFSASNSRDWSPEFEKLPQAEISDGVVHLRNIRNCQYVTQEDFVVNHYDRSFRLDSIESVDFVVCPFNRTPLLAHTMLSFGLIDGSRVGVSIETRKEKDESFSPLLGTARQYELMYVVADEKDLIRLRTEHRDSEVYIYPTVANAKQSQDLFVDVMNRANQLAIKPEFYNSLVNNCTTNLAGHVNGVAGDKIFYNWRVLLPGFSAQYAYDLGLLPNDIPYEDLTAIAYANDRANQHSDHPEFSKVIRQRHDLIDRMVRRQNLREPILGGSGDEYLAEQESTLRWR